MIDPFLPVIVRNCYFYYKNATGQLIMIGDLYLS